MSTSGPKQAQYPHQIVERVAEFMSAGDMEGVVSMFHPECVMAMDPDGEPLVGHDAVRGVFGDFVGQRMVLEGEVTGEMINGDTALLQGNWRILDQQGNTVMGGDSSEVAKRTAEGGWVYYIDCPLSVPKPKRG